MSASAINAESIGAEFLIPKRPEPILPLGYAGRVRLVQLSADGSLGWVEKLDPRGPGDDFVRALVNISDLRLIKDKKDDRQATGEPASPSTASLIPELTAESLATNAEPKVAASPGEEIRSLHLNLNLFG